MAPAHDFKLDLTRSALRRIDDAVAPGAPHWDFAAELLLRAAETGKRRDVEAATAQMERALRVQCWL